MESPDFVTITSSAKALVISELIVDDGRERHENGSDPLEPGVPRHFIIDNVQSLRVVKYVPPPVVEPPADLAPPPLAPQASVETAPADVKKGK